MGLALIEHFYACLYEEYRTFSAFSRRRKERHIYIRYVLGAKFIFKKGFSHFQCSQSSERDDISPKNKWEKWGFVFIKLLF